MTIVDMSIITCIICSATKTIWCPLIVQRNVLHAHSDYCSHTISYPVREYDSALCIM